MFSCYKDKSNTTFKTLNEIKINGIKDYYRVIRIADRFNIKPTIFSKDKAVDFEYFWGYYKNPKIVIEGEGAFGNTKIDTIQIGKEKELISSVKLDAGSYVLIFGVKNVKTGIVTFKNTVLTVETATSNGLYILKEDDKCFTDLDFYDIIGKKLMTSIIAKTQGSSLKGKPVSLGYTGQFNYFDPQTNENIADIKSIIPMSESDMSIIRIKDIKKLANYKTLFYSIPESSCKPIAYIWKIYSYAYFINDGKAYYKTTDFASRGKFGFAVDLEKKEYNNYFLSQYLISALDFGYNPIVFDKTHSTFCTLIKGELRLFKNEGVDINHRNYYPNKNLASDICYMNYCKDMMDMPFGIALLKKNSAYYLYHLDINTSLDIETIKELFGFASDEAKEYQCSNPVFKIDTLSSYPAGIKLANADLYSTHKRGPFIYYTKDNKISIYDIENKEGKLIKTLDAGEKITYVNQTEIQGADLLIVASSLSNGNYKIYLFELDMEKLGKLVVPIIKGKGKVKDVHYATMVENDN
jgi:hypothetical protein